MTEKSLEKYVELQDKVVSKMQGYRIMYLAERTGISHDTVRCIANGTIRNPKWIHLQALIEAMEGENE